MFNKLSIIILWTYIIPLGVIFATSVIFFQNTLYLAFNFIIILLVSALIVFSLRAEFLGYIILIVYIGAIAILFLFIIMMLNLKINFKLSNIFSNWESCILFFLIYKILIISKLMLIPNLIFINNNGLIWLEFWNKYNYKNYAIAENYNFWLPTKKIETLAELIYNDFSFLVIIVGIILLVAMVGALIITTSKSLIIKNDA